MFRYRDHKGGLAESLETTQEFTDKDALLEYLQKTLDQFCKTGLDLREIKIEPYGFDERIGWDSHIVHLEGWGVFGFTDKAI